MASKFITNDENGITLTNLIKSTINISDSLDFLVGYFFFSGFGEIYKDIKDKHLRILIGMNADVDVHNAIFEYTTYNNQKSFLPSIQNVQNEWIENSIKIINNADFVDTKINIDALLLRTALRNQEQVRYVIIDVALWLKVAYNVVCKTKRRFYLSDPR